MCSVCAGMVRCLLSRHSERSCVHSGLRHLLFRQLWVCQKHAAADLRDQVRDGNIFLILFLFLHTHLHLCPFSLPVMLYLLTPEFSNVSALLYLLHVSQPFFSSMFCNYAQKPRLFCNHGLPAYWVISSSFGSKSTEILFSSADCKGHLQKPIQKPQRLFEVWWWGLFVADFGCILYLFDTIHSLTWYPYVKSLARCCLNSLSCYCVNEYLFF